MSCALFATIFLAVGSGAEAQNFSSSGNDWASGWGFQSATDRSLALQQAQTIRNATTSAGPSTVISNAYYNQYDNRSGYLELNGDQAQYGDLDVNMNGDEIGQNTNSIGAMNTGTTNIDVNGNQNIVDATNAADSTGCIDGSVSINDTAFASMETTSGIDITLGATSPITECLQ